MFTQNRDTHTHSYAYALLTSYTQHTFKSRRTPILLVGIINTIASPEKHIHPMVHLYTNTHNHTHTKNINTHRDMLTH
uniref:Uncharacterized protein n=1 Tax=Octopus bimaculoides TaxID=37653 RepID=A0A0L8HCI9_OCTBM